MSPQNTTEHRKSIDPVGHDLSSLESHTIPAVIQSSPKPTKASPTSMEEPKLIHPTLLKIPMQIRFGIAGFISNVLFMAIYNTAIAYLEHAFHASTIYSVVYFFFIPLSHALTSFLVFGWPAKYVSSLLSNFPIGITAMLLGAYLTAFMDRIGFEEIARDWVQETFVGHPGRPESDDHDEGGEFYSSLVVLTITSIWTYILSVLVNSQSSNPVDKKEL